MIRKFSALLFIFFSFSLFAQDLDIDMDQVGAEENFEWGVRSFHNGFYNNALQYFEKSLGLKAGNELTRYWMGNALYKAGFEQAALNEWNTLLVNKPDNPVVSYKAQVIRARRGVGSSLAGEDRLVVVNTMDASSAYQFNRPTSIKPREDGSVYVVVYGSNEVLKINANGIVAEVIKGGISAFNHPFDLLENKDGTFFLTEYEGDRVILCRPNGTRISEFGKKGVGPGEFLGPQYIAEDDEGYLFITDWGNSRVAKFDRQGNFILNFGSGGRKEADLAGPVGIVFYEGFLLVSDKIKKDIRVYDSSGNFIRSIRGRGELTGPEGLFYSPGGEVLVVDSSPAGTRVFSLNVKQESFSLVYDFSKIGKRLMGVALDRNHNWIAADYDANKIFILSEMDRLFSGYMVQVERISSEAFPEIVMDVSVETPGGDPVLGLIADNFILSEKDKPVNFFTLYNPVVSQESLSLAILVEKSPAMKENSARLAEALADLLKSLGPGVSSEIIVMEDSASIIEKKAVLDTVERVLKEPFSDDWQLDQGLRLAGNRLLNSRTKRAVVYLSSGEIGRDPYSNYALLELEQFFKNNHIVFNVLLLSGGELHEDLAFLCQSTGGQQSDFFDPRGIQPFADQLKQISDSRYTIKYTSLSHHGFGRTYIPLALEVSMNKISGKDLSGYYAPVQ